MPLGPVLEGLDLVARVAGRDLARQLPNNSVDEVLRVMSVEDGKARPTR